MAGNSYPESCTLQFTYFAVANTSLPVFTTWLLCINQELSPGLNLYSSFPPVTRNWMKSPRFLWSAANRRRPSLAFVLNFSTMVFSSKLNAIVLCSKKEPRLKAGKWSWAPSAEWDEKCKIQLHEITVIYCKLLCSWSS